MGILGAFIIALIVAYLFAPYKKNSSLSPLLVLFFVLFMAGMAAQYWVLPFGPVIWGVSWLPVLFVVLVFALLFSSPPPRGSPAPVNEAAEGIAALAISIFIWILLILLFVAILAGLYKSGNDIAA